MDREKLFEDFINECDRTNNFCGQGNPNADILIIGKESTATKDSLVSESIMRCRDKKERDAPRPINPKNKTWANYQKLLDEIYHRKSDDPDKWDFEKYAFTTELSSIPRKQSKYSDAKSSIQNRLILFRESKFIQSFPVIILACSNYIRNDEKNREIYDTFRVEFCPEYGSKEGKYLFWPHFDDINAPRKLVIHTRQFSLRYMNQEDRERLINEMASVIRKHLAKLGLI